MREQPAAEQQLGADGEQRQAAAAHVRDRAERHGLGGPGRLRQGQDEAAGGERLLRRPGHLRQGGDQWGRGEQGRPAARQRPAHQHQRLLAARQGEWRGHARVARGHAAGGAARTHRVDGVAQGQGADTG